MPTMLQLLNAGVPVTLLLDLLSTDPVESHALFSDEAADTSWVPRQASVA